MARTGSDRELEMEYTDLRSKIIAVTEKELFSKSIIEKKAYAEAAYFLMNDISIDENDIFAGNLEKCWFANIYPAGLEQEIEYFLKNDRDHNEKYRCMLAAKEIGLFTRAPGAHVVPAYDRLIQEGIQNRIDRIQCHMETCTGNREKENFYAAEIIVLKAMQKRIMNYAVEAGKKYAVWGKDNIKRIQDACNRIAIYPPAGFHEALQLIFLAHEHILAEGGSGSISFGRMDQYLYPYYKKDLESGKITKEEAQEMITAFWRKIAEYEMSWQNVTIGGSDRNGNDMCNDLTIFCMNASLAVRGDQPQVSLRVHKGLPKEVWEKAFELIETGMGFPDRKSVV